MNTPVLFLVFNRPHCTKQSLQAIRAARPSKLYIAADGPRRGRDEELQATDMVRAIATAVDWPCEVSKLFQTGNLGCKHAVVSALDWFFTNEESGIIIEDDCLPSPDFFPYCEALLQRYANTEEVALISGANFVPHPAEHKYTYRFSRYANIWGWASWRRTWQSYDKDIAFWPSWKSSNEWAHIFPDPVERRYWERILDATHDGQIDTWDYQLAACMWRRHMYSVCPNTNLVANIGFDSSATHTRQTVKQLSLGHVGKILHPPEVRLDVHSDTWFFDNQLGGRFMKWPLKVFAKPRTLLNKVRSGAARWSRS
jgi:hypothetical protein